jgi:hypothetical protein
MRFSTRDLASPFRLGRERNSAAISSGLTGSRPFTNP